MDKRNKTVNEIKKEYLWRYQECVRRIRRINAEIPEIRGMKMGIAINNDGMPHGSGQNDLSGYAAELDKLERELTDERYTRIIIYKDIKKRIDKLKSTNEKEKVTSAEIASREVDGKTYYAIKYKEVGKDYYTVGYGSYKLDYVVCWLNECFEFCGEAKVVVGVGKEHIMSRFMKVE